MKITISTLSGNDANFGTWLQLISLYKYLEEKFKATPSIRSRPFIWDKMLCKDVFNSSFDYFNFNICDPKNSDYILIGSDFVLGIKSDWYTDKWFTHFIKFDGIDDKKKIIIEDPISSLGTHNVKIELHSKVSATIKITLVKEQ